mgnify:FL=1
MKTRRLIKNKEAVSEEFTALPALSVVMIGFTLFFLLIANTYNSYEDRIEILEKYKTADFIATKLTNPDCFFIKEGGVVDTKLLTSDRGKNELNFIRDEYNKSGFDFIIRISCGQDKQDFPETVPTDTKDKVAVTKEIGVYLNEAQTKPGKLTVILWSIF